MIHSIDYVEIHANLWLEEQSAFRKQRSINFMLNDYKFISANKLFLLRLIP